MRDEIETRLERVLVGAPEPAAIVIVDYDPGWPDRFRREEQTLQVALGERAAMIEHIGSTAVPSLAAKPIIDILLVVEDSGDEDAYAPALIRAGYELRVREPDFDEHRMLRTPARDVHVHVFSTGSAEIARHLLLRDGLRAHESERQLYADTKRRLAARPWKTMQHYADAKTDVIEAIIARAVTESGSNRRSR